MTRQKRLRPAKISNANCCYSNDDVAAVAATPDSDLRWSAFKVIFAISGCTATYEERLYFLPLALEYLRQHPHDGAEYTSDLVYFLSTHAEELRRDGLLDETVTAIKACVASWTKTFSVVHFDRDACRAKGWRLDHDDLVTNSEVVKELVDDLLRFKTHATLAEELVLQWVRPGRSAQEAAWLLEFARAEHQGYAYYVEHPTPPHLDMVPTKSATRIHSTITSRHALELAFRDVADTIIPNTESPTYWRDCLAQLGLAAA